MSEIDPPGFHVERQGDVLIVRLTGPNVPPDLGEPLYRLVEEGVSNRFVLNLGAIRYLSSNGIGILATLRKRLDAVGGTLVACQVDPEVHQLLKYTNLDRLIPILDTEQDALAVL
ncbi:MAG TPA: STAS domain-containing protein [Isosphaeraceae bacterium]|nr:STAS domain-containing protein [Isosphaeraceae bacterium]